MAKRDWLKHLGFATATAIATSKITPMANEPTITYTKGEWYLQKYTDAYTNIVRCNNGKHETIFIASTPQSSLPEARANAMLMSAAPDLLEALKEVIAISDRDHIAWNKAKAAIVKAVGGEYYPNQQEQKDANS